MSLPSSPGSSKDAVTVAVDATVNIEQLARRGEQYKLRFPEVNEAKLMRKIDLKVIPVLCVMYLLAYLDRVNIGNAVLFGLKEDLRLEGTQYNSALVVFFIPYMLFDIPFNALVKRLRPHVWLSMSMFLFGLLSVCQGLTQNLSGLVATRFFLGLVESGVFPACLYLISMWYRRAEAQKRYSFFFSSTTLGGAFGGLLASAIGKMDGLGGYRGWRWIFIVEGALTCAVSIALYFFISDFPEEANWLTPKEREFVQARLREDVGESCRDDPLTVRSVLAVFKDVKIIIGGFMYLGLVCAGYSYAYFSPAIIQSLGHSSIRTQLISVPPWACACVVAMVVATISDHIRHRFLFVVSFTMLALAGYVMLLVVHDRPNVQYAALFLPAMGTYTAMPIAICWFGINLGGHRRRAVGTAWQIGFGSSA
ncbi:hypothetical protein EVJ58_g1414 [Rhodofomes roseus]|uniref:Major facilitator superfamily (MFS) profile domain-containing protein n=1 Tax=Rhodofomes roseus TaxID=34475 RepID=A0A4Y9Z1N7_9APHY|nr:hypothetical protein EVJ58_g1414 [Rhodofomes roseus]